MQSCELATSFVMEFPKNLQAEFNFNIFKFAGSSLVIFMELMSSSSSFYRV